MKMNAGISLVLAIVAGLLGYSWYKTDKRAAEDRTVAMATVERLSNAVERVTTDLTETRAVANELRTNLDERTFELVALSNKLLVVKADLANTTALLDRSESRAKTDADKARTELEERDKRISGLEGEKEDLTGKLTALNKQIAGLETRIGEYRRQLAESEGDRTVLLAHLRELQGEKAELERKFQDLDYLRDLVRKRREEAAIAKRAEFRRKGVFGLERKGAELLTGGLRTSTTNSTRSPSSNLQIEVDTSGAARVISPTNTTTSPTP